MAILRCNRWLAWCADAHLRLLLVTLAAVVGCGETPDPVDGDAGPATEDAGRPDPVADAGPDPAEEDAGDTPTTCGDRTLDDGEACDDGNGDDGDGCSSECEVESGFNCPTPGLPCQKCGNGIKESAEECDDGNRDSGDGCSSACALEGAFVCPVPGRACNECGNGTVEGLEVCDDGNTDDGDGCSNDCGLIDLGFNCDPTGGACEECGDGVVGPGEVCDDGNRFSLDGCLFNCSAIEDGYVCPTPPTGGQCKRCGNRRLEWDEECDDGNGESGDGCDADCRVEPGFTCAVVGRPCYECGNGFQEGAAGSGEACDDGRSCADGQRCVISADCTDGSTCEPRDGDGCSASCMLETDQAWICPIPGEPCVSCGNGTIEGGLLFSEECDDGEQCSDGTACSSDADCVGIGDESCRSRSGDGCSEYCQVEIGATCDNSTPQNCVRCGDGTVQPTNCPNGNCEQCDDGNRFDRDGCSASCQLEPGWTCPPGESCFFCGNGIKEAAEACDDGNTTGGDGCDASCAIEAGWDCRVLSGSLRSTCDTCGNGRRRLDEECDDGNAVAGDGCTACILDSGWNCPDPGGIACNNCGNGIVEGYEVCDVGPVSGAGCLDACMTIAPHYYCSPTGGPCYECGDGVLDPNEACDDGNTGDGDGCRGDCRQVEPGWICGGDGSGGTTCTLCGNGVLDPTAGETCDDGNDIAGDGCSSCAVDDGWNCFPSVGSNPLSRSRCDECGNRVVLGDEQCDDGNTADGDGCSSSCTTETGWTCPALGGRCSNCGNGAIEPGEACDEGNDTSAGCAPDCSRITDDWYCPQAGVACEECGDGQIGLGEVCDDGNAASGDGCRSDCRQIEEGWLCSGEPSACTLCGNGIVDSGAGETCDDGNSSPGDGCSATCRVEAGPYNCVTPGLPCEECGDGILDAHEACDDGNVLGTGAGPADGCAADCQAVDPGWACVLPGTECGLCGNGTIEGTEQCDDGTPAGGDGCAACVLEDGWACDDTGCVSLGCGDGFVAGNEECDDGNTVGGDGCSVRCQVEDGYSCPATGGTCVDNVCGDTIVAPDEQCDDGNFVSGDGCVNCLFEGFCGDGAVGADQNGDPEQCDSGGVSVAGCDGACQWVPGYACVGDAPDYVCQATTCGDGILGNLEACDDGNTDGGDGCDASCEVENLHRCTGDIGDTSTCSPLFQWVIVREFRVTNIDPEAIHFDPNTRSFVGYKQQTSQNIVELCLDGSMVQHPVRRNSNDFTICEPGEDPDSGQCDIYTAADFPGPFRDYPTEYNSVTAATFDPISSTWFFVDGSRLMRVSTLPWETYNAANWPVPSPGIAPNNITLNGTPLAGTTGIAIGDDGRFYMTTTNGTVRAFARSAGAMGFDFSAADQTWDFSGSGTVNGLFSLSGYNAIATITIADGADPFTDLVSIDTTRSTGDTSFGISSIPGALFAGVTHTDGHYYPVDVFGNIYKNGNNYDDAAGDFYLFRNIATGAETSTDGSGFLVCTSTNSESCYLFAQACQSDSDCFNGATCQTTYVDEGGVTRAYEVPFCASVGRARDDFANTSRYIDAMDNGEVVIDVLRNDTRSSGTCREAMFEIQSTTQGTLGGTTSISYEAADCGSQSSCVVYFPPTDGTCNIVDTFTYTVLLGGGETDTATVRVTVACDCGDGELDLGEECDGAAGVLPGQSCSSTCELVPVCGNGHVEGMESCDDGNHLSGDGCSWDCRSEGCGNGVHDAGEECDDGNAVSGDGCSRTCLNEVCGNGRVDAGEQCDDANAVETDGCLSTCVVGAVCGDGIRAGAEECDDGNPVDTDGCTNDCRRPVCGDDVVSDGEQCDDGNVESGDGCTWDCRIEACGDGKFDVHEQCDDGNTTSGDGCSSNCMIEGCGNGVLEPALGEECDGTSNCRADCTVIACGDGILDGVPLAAAEECDDGNLVDNDGCSSTCRLEAICGDGEVNGTEECDYLDPTTDPMGRTCSRGCIWEACGNAFVEAGEECDDGANGDPSDGCRDDCRVPRCGDGVVDRFRGETCDDGNLTSGDGCNPFCLVEPECGNGQVDPGEECDDGGVCSDNGLMACVSDADCGGTCEPVGGDGCSASCLFEGCGNGTVEGGEACDPAAPSAPAECRLDCTLAMCGDRIVDPGEECDDGANGDNSDGCTDTCLLTTVCGDGIREASEQCDDGNTATGDGCSAICRWEYCGNGVIDVDSSGAPVEECDDGGNVSGDGCSSICEEEPVCGDGVLESPEQCDDGNTISGDGCASDCLPEAYCGDGKVDPGEECDPADPANGSSCTQNCRYDLI